MKVSVIGTGYVGLVAGACFADAGNDVVCVDIDERKIALLKRGKIPIFEPGLGEMVKMNCDDDRLRFTTDISGAVRDSLVNFVAVGTPPGPDGHADLKYVRAVAESIGRNMNGYKVVVNKSTVPVGTARLVAELIARHTDHEFDVVSNPEFLKEGAAINDFLFPDRVVIGADSERAAAIMRELYEPFCRTGAPIYVMDIPSAEMTKYASNAMLASRISFMNELARLCEKVGADVKCVREGMGSDRRIGKSFLFPGAGYGGSCFPKDVKAIINTARKNGLDFKLLKAVERVNAEQKQLLFKKVSRYFGGRLAGKTFAVWGLAFKAKTDDMRDAPAIELINALLGAKAKVRAHDAEAIGEARKIWGNRITYCQKRYAALSGADALVIVTDWNSFRRPDFGRIKRLLKAPAIFDGRNLYEPDEMEKLGFDYFCIGRGRKL